MAPSTPAEVATGSDESAGSVVKPLGLTLADAKALLAAIQRHLVQAEDGGLHVVSAAAVAAFAKSNARWKRRQEVGG